MKKIMLTLAAICLAVPAFAWWYTPCYFTPVVYTTPVVYSTPVYYSVPTVRTYTYYSPVYYTAPVVTTYYW